MDIKVSKLYVNKETEESFQIHSVREDSVAGFFVGSLDVGVVSFEDLQSQYREATYEEYVKALESCETERVAFVQED